MSRRENPRTDDLPPAMSAMWRALKRAYQAEPRLLPVSLGLSLLAALPDWRVVNFLTVKAGWQQAANMVGWYIDYPNFVRYR